MSRLIPVLRGRGKRYKLLDRFSTARAAGAVNGTPSEPGPGGRRVIRDVESKISIANGVETWAAQATPVYAEQDRVYDQLPVTRAFGIVAICKWRVGTVGDHYPLAFVTSKTPTWGGVHVDAGFDTNGAGSLRVIYGGVIGPIVAVPSTATDYLLAIELRANGAIWKIKGGAFANWTKLFKHTLGSTATLYVASAGYTAVFTLDNVLLPARKIQFSPLASDSFAGNAGSMNGRLTDGLGAPESGGGGLPWTATTWTVDGAGAAVNTPTQGAEIVLTPDFASDTNWTKDALWTISSGALHAAAVGQYSQTIQGSIFAVGNWYLYSLDVLNNVTGNMFFQEGSNTTLRQTTGNGTYLGTYRSIVGGQLNLKASLAASTFDVDNVSAKLLTLSTLFSSLVLSTVNVMGDCVIKTLVAGTQAGGVARLDNAASPANFIIYYENGAGNIKVDECVAGTYTNLLSAVKAAATGDILRLWLNGSAWRLYHITSAGVATLQGSGTTNVTTGFLCGEFLTYSGNAIESCVWSAVGAENQYNALDAFV